MSAPGFFAEFVDGRRGEILDAALKVFGEKGYEAGTMREIAGVVGVTEPALYRHYSGKEALLVDLVETAGKRMAQTATASLAQSHREPLGSAIQAMVRDRRDVMAGNSQLMRTLTVAAHHNEAAREAFQRAVSLPLRDALREFVSRTDAAQGIIRPAAELDAGVSLMMSLIIGHLLTSRLLIQENDDRFVVQGLMRMMGWSEAEGDPTR